MAANGKAQKGFDFKCNAVWALFLLQYLSELLVNYIRREADTQQQQKIQIIITSCASSS